MKQVWNLRGIMLNKKLDGNVHSLSLPKVMHCICCSHIWLRSKVDHGLYCPSASGKTVLYTKADYSDVEMETEQSQRSTACEEVF